MITRRRPIEDPIREWGQLLAYLTEIRRTITENGPSVVLVPSPRLGNGLDQGAETARFGDVIGSLNTDVNRHPGRKN